MESPDTMPTASDFAWSDAQAAKQAAEGNRDARLKLEDRVVVLEGQVGFLAKMIYNMRTSLGRAEPEDMALLERIRDYKVKE